MEAATDATQMLVAVASLAALIGGLWVVVRRAERGRRRRDEELWRRWNEVREYADAGPGHRDGALGQIREHRQRARRGLKAYVFWPATGEVSAAWFWHRWPPVGAYVVARGSWGAGEHHSENVFYIQPDELVAIVDGNAPAAWERHERRRQQEAPTACAPLN
jgi:hypothetical protein